MARRLFMVGDRVRVSDRHMWFAGRSGIIIEVEDRTGNRFTVRMDREEIGLFCEDVQVMTVDKGTITKKGPARLLRLGDIDLEYIEPASKLL